MCKTEDTRRAAGANTTPPSSARGVGKGGDGLKAAPLVTIASRLQEGEEAREQSEKENRVKRTSELWQIHGKHFDLSGFLGQHPGGASILEAVRGAEDITPMFESYHALANTSAIRKSLEKFEWLGKVVDDVSEREAALVGGISKQPTRYRWDEGGFYEVLKARVKGYFLKKHGQGEVDPRKVSVNRYIKAPFTWYLKEMLVLGVYLSLFVYMLGFDVFGIGVFGSSAASSSSLFGGVGRLRAGAAFLAGAMLQAFSFCTLHDASHYGLWFKRPRAQEVLSRVCNAWTLWHHGLWVMHHVYGHHSFTGDPERDPDLVHARPYLRKSVLAPEDQYDPFLMRWQLFHAPLFMMVMPGASMGQTMAYRRALREGHLWHVSIPAGTGRTRWYEYLTYVLAVGAHVLAANVFVSFCYFMGISVTYHLCIAPDHDTFESAVVNSIENKPRGREREQHSRGEGETGRSSSGGDPAGSDLCDDNGCCREAAGGCDDGVEGNGAGDDRGHSDDEGRDWGEVQVRHSGNFSNGNPLVTHFMGGINFQIEHHLFPSVSHMLYGEIAPIVRAACREFNIPYNSHPSLFSAYKSYLKHLRFCSGATTGYSTVSH